MFIDTGKEPNPSSNSAAWMDHITQDVGSCPDPRTWTWLSKSSRLLPGPKLSGGVCSASSNKSCFCFTTSLDSVLLLLFFKRVQTRNESRLLRCLAHGNIIAELSIHLNNNFFDRNSNNQEETRMFFNPGKNSCQSRLLFPVGYSSKSKKKNKHDNWTTL